MAWRRGSITKSSTWRIDTWDDFYYEQYPDESKWLSHRDLSKELDVLINNLEPETKERKKVAAVKRHLKKSGKMKKKICRPLLLKKVKVLLVTGPKLIHMEGQAVVPLEMTHISYVMLLNTI
ncbi:hypothetical protein RhiirA5_453774 [Rhizophagus irregularis]|uniref:Uncharacterized protein n=1 Tax=Rhizophagus irregularis TaxID=588596 RepID=A0A2N0R803_9GLOM|nr:hypothetical protein RhiirA5_453774 [Rhizophagus irregularis]PKC59443.1 hypothetical protein RhiirA1_492939 [Rhizophagus irregularis]